MISSRTKCKFCPICHHFQRKDTSFSIKTQEPIDLFQSPPEEHTNGQEINRISP